MGREGRTKLLMSCEYGNCLRPHLRRTTPLHGTKPVRKDARGIECAEFYLTSRSASVWINTVQRSEPASTKTLRSVQKLHSETAFITPYNGTINIQSSTWNAQPKCRGHDRRAIDLDNRRGIREVPDLAPHKTAVDQYLRSIDVTSPLIRHVSQSPPI